MQNYIIIIYSTKKDINIYDVKLFHFSCPLPTLQTSSHFLPTPPEAALPLQPNLFFSPKRLPRRP